MKSPTLMMIAALLAFGACDGAAPIQVQTEPLFKDVSHRPPEPKPATLDAIDADPAFADWVIYQVESCDKYGCVQ